MGNTRKRVFLMVLGLLVLQLAAFAGGNGDKTFLDETMHVVKKKRHAAFYRTVEAAGDKGYLVKAYFLSGELKMNGYYRDKSISIPHGKFTFYYKNGQVESTGNYTDGLKSGIWERYRKNGDEKAEKIYGNYYHSIVVDDPDKFPKYDGGKAAMQQYIDDTLIYPSKARASHIEGEVMLTYTVAYNGEITDVRAADGVPQSLSVEAIRVVSQMPAWKPGKLDGHPVNVRMKMPVKFEL